MNNAYWLLVSITQQVHYVHDSDSGDAYHVTHVRTDPAEPFGPFDRAIIQLSDGNSYRVTVEKIA